MIEILLSNVTWGGLIVFLCVAAFINGFVREIVRLFYNS